jgi:myosin heavy subunit
VRHWASLPGDVRKDVQYRLRGWKNRDEAIGRVLDYLKNAKKEHYDHVLPD